MVSGNSRQRPEAQAIRNHYHLGRAGDYDYYRPHNRSGSGSGALRRVANGAGVARGIVTPSSSDRVRLESRRFTEQRLARPFANENRNMGARSERNARGFNTNPASVNTNNRITANGIVNNNRSRPSETPLTFINSPLANPAVRNRIRTRPAAALVPPIRVGNNAPTAPRIFSSYTPRPSISTIPLNENSTRPANPTLPAHSISRIIPNGPPRCSPPTMGPPPLPRAANPPIRILNRTETSKTPRTVIEDQKPVSTVRRPHVNRNWNDEPAELRKRGFVNKNLINVLCGKSAPRTKRQDGPVLRVGEHRLPNVRILEMEAPADEDNAA